MARTCWKFGESRAHDQTLVLGILVFPGADADKMIRAGESCDAWPLAPQGWQAQRAPILGGGVGGANYRSLMISSVIEDPSERVE